MPNPPFSTVNDESTDSPEPPIQRGAAGLPQMQPRDRRREKPQLSCNYCKRRKYAYSEPPQTGPYLMALSTKAAIVNRRLLHHDRLDSLLTPGEMVLASD